MIVELLILDLSEKQSVTFDLCFFYTVEKGRIHVDIARTPVGFEIHGCQTPTLVSLISEHARLEKNSSFSSLLALIRACSFIRFLGILPCSLSFHQRKCPFFQPACSYQILLVYQDSKKIPPCSLIKACSLIRDSRVSVQL